MTGGVATVVGVNDDGTVSITGDSNDTSDWINGRAAQCEDDFGSDPLLFQGSAPEAYDAGFAVKDWAFPEFGDVTWAGFEMLGFVEPTAEFIPADPGSIRKDLENFDGGFTTNPWTESAYAVRGLGGDLGIRVARPFSVETRNSRSYSGMTPSMVSNFIQTHELASAPLVDGVLFASELMMGGPALKWAGVGIKNIANNTAKKYLTTTINNTIELGIRRGNLGGVMTLDLASHGTGEIFRQTGKFIKNKAVQRVYATEQVIEGVGNYLSPDGPVLITGPGGFLGAVGQAVFGPNYGTEN